MKYKYNKYLSSGTETSWLRVTTLSWQKINTSWNTSTTQQSYDHIPRCFMQMATPQIVNAGTREYRRKSWKAECIKLESVKNLQPSWENREHQNYLRNAIVLQRKTNKVWEK